MAFSPVVSFASGSATAEPPAGGDYGSVGNVSFSSDANGTISLAGGGFTDTKSADGKTNAWVTLLTKYRGFIAGIAGVGAVTMIVLFIVQFMKLGASAGNPQARSQALVGVLWTGIAAAGLGAVTLIVGFFFNSIK